MLRRQPSTLFGLLLIFLMAACTPATTTDESVLSDDNLEIATYSSTDLPDQAITEPPPATLTIDGQEQKAGITGYCWQRGDGTSICADGIGFTTAPDPIPAESTFLAQFEFMLDVKPGRVQLSILPASQPVLMGPEDSDWRFWKSVPGDQFTLSPNNNPYIELTLEPGLYVFDMFVDWPDYGGVNYGFLVNVGGASGRDSTAFVDDQGLPLDEATYRTRFEETIGEFQSLLMADLTDTYGGLWVEQHPEYRIVIALTEGDLDTVRPYLDGYEWADYVEVLPVNYTLEELRADQAIASQAADSVQMSTITAVDIVDNRVELIVGNPDLFLADLTQAGVQLPGSVVVLAIDPLSQPDLPVILDPGSPPSDRCVVVHPGGTAVVTVYLGPSTTFAPVARLGNFAVVFSSENGWHQIQIGPGQTGWIRETDVGFAGPCDHVNEVVRFEVQANGSPLRTSSTILPGQAHRYLFGAEAGSRVLIDLTSTGQVNFALQGVDDGQPLKRVVNEDRMWEGILPGTQDYMLTVVPGDEAADYELLVALVAAPPLVIIYDAHSDALLGGFQDALWVDGSTAAGALLGGEQYDVYHLGQRLGQAGGSAPVPTVFICPGHTVHLTPPPSHPSALAVTGATWEVALRLVAPVELSQVERQAVADLLASQGLAISATDLQLQEAFGTDLDGDGSGEIIALASRLRADGSTPAVDAGDYVVVAVLMEISGQLHAEPLVLNVFLQADDQAYPWRYKVSGALDLNGDGNLEVILAGTRWEGTGTIVYSVGTAGGTVPVLEWNCTE